MAFGIWNVLTESRTQLFALAILIPVAILVFFFGSRGWRRDRGASSLRPRGRSRRADSFSGARRRGRPEFEQLREAPPTPIARASRGWVRFEGRIIECSPRPPGADKPCVWRNREGAPPEAAIAADLVLIADATGRCGIEHLDRADVRAPSIAIDRHNRALALHVGDLVEVCGWFEPEGEKQAPEAHLVYGTVDGSRELVIGSLPERASARSPSSTTDAPEVS